MNALIQQILSEPQAFLIMQEVQAALQQEQKRRAAFYQEMDEQQKVEFVNGEVVYHSPAKKRHNQVNLQLAKVLSTYVDAHELGFVGIEKILISLTRNDYEPDLCFFSTEKARHFTEDQMKFPAPDLVVEVLSASTEARDREVKFKDYEAHGIAEYWMIDPEQETIEQYTLANGSYQLRLKGSDGSLQSQAVSGFVTPIRAVFDRALNLSVMRKMIT